MTRRPTYLLLDVDNTVYPRSSRMNDEIQLRMTRIVAEYLAVSEERALELRNVGVPRYGTTLAWLRGDHGYTDVQAFFREAHPEDISAVLPPDPQPASVVRQLGMPYAILTNAPRVHAERVLRHYGLWDDAEHVFDIESNGLVGKPHEQAYRTALHTIGVSPDDVVFVDDVPLYLEPFRAMGGMVVLVDEDGRYAQASDIPAIRTIADLPQMIARFGSTGRTSEPVVV